MKKYRLDELLVLKNLVDSRIKAREFILDGKVYVDGQVFYKPSKKLREDVKIEINKPTCFVSRGGYKLNKAINDFKLDVKNKVCIDIGASTGGFTDCLLKNEAKSVIAVDNGKNQLHQSLIKNPQIINIEEFNARNIEDLFKHPEKYKIPKELINDTEIITIDVSFISVTLITQSISFIENKKKLNIVILIKPNFELTKKEIKYLKKGVLKDRKTILAVLLRTLKKIRNQGFKFINVIESPIKGDKGNTEFLAYFIKE
ncbi:MAG: TlyA family RNA methyltransferase [bacterium]|nr:TlyA family RNA methyltransferase [bacterium]